MDIRILFELIAGLFGILILLLLVFVLPARAKKKRQKEKEKQEESFSVSQERSTDLLDFDSLRAIVRDRKSTKKQLEEAVDTICTYYAVIPPKRGIRSHGDFDKYVELIIRLVRHPNTDKQLILKLDRTLLANNPSYKAELNDALAKALNSRG